MPFLLLLVLTLTCLQRKWPAPPGWYSWPGSVLLTWSAIAVLGILAWVPAGWWRRRLERDPSCRYAVWRRYHSFRRWHVYAVLITHLLVLNFAGWGWFIGERFVHGDIPTPGIDFLLLAPLFAGLMLSWAAYHPLEKLLAQTGFHPSADAFPGRLGYVALQLRHNLILVAPPLLLMFSHEVILALWPDLTQSDWILPVIALGLLAAMYVAVPWVLRILLGLKPLPAGPLRDRLLAMARRLSFRFSDILVWNTRQTIVNAMVTGPLPVLRYVVLTDRLIDELTPDEVEAVFGHEVGHIKHHHLLFYFGFLMASMIAVVGLWEAAAELFDESPMQAWITENVPEVAEWLASYAVVSALPLLALLAVYVVVVFGYLSRRCERQADIFGCHTVSVPVFVSALEKVGVLNGIHRERPGWLQAWQHSTIERRVAFLQKMHAEPDVEPRFQRRVGLVKWGVLLCLAVVIVLLGNVNLKALLGM